MAEPFAWYRYQWGERVYYDSKKWENCQPLYAHPKEWVGLTADEIFNTLISVDEKTARLPYMLGQFACAIEAKLKEKNT